MASFNTTAVAFSAISAATLYLYLNRYGKPSASGKEWEDIPGPRGRMYWLTGNTLDFLAAFTDGTSDFYKDLVPLARNPDYKTFAAQRIFGRRFLFINDPALMKEIMVKGLSRYADLNAPFTRMKLMGEGVVIWFGGEIIVNSWGHEWKWRRNAVEPWFQPRKIVPMLLPFVVNRANKLIDDLAKTQGKPIEVSSKFSALTFDVICQYVFGRSGLEELDFSDLGGSYEGLDRNIRDMSTGFSSAWARMPIIGKTEWAQKPFKPARERILRFLSKAIDRALLDAAKSDGGFTSVVAEMAKEEGYNATSGTKTREGLERELMLIIIAGFDTTSHTLAFISVLLSMYPRVQEKIREEVHMIFGEGPDLQTITAEQLGNMAYITAVIRETMRLYPTVAFQGATVQQDTEISGYIVPKDTTIFCNNRGSYRRYDIFPDPDEFVPERWLPKDGSRAGADDAIEDVSKIGQDSKQTKLPELVFGLGPHACLGKNLAYIEMRSVIAKMVGRFDLRLKEGYELHVSTESVTRPRDGAWVVLTDRKANKSV